MDNRVFNVNGKGEEMLLKALELVFQQEGDRTLCQGWLETEQHGLILLWTSSEQCNRLPAGLTAAQAFPFVIAWLQGDFAKKVVTQTVKTTKEHTEPNWDAPYNDGDVTEHVGWRVYCEGWGHVNGLSAAICAIKPVSLWYGK